MIAMSAIALLLSVHDPSMTHDGDIIGHQLAIDKK
jgi:hypothetical protein